MTTNELTSKVEEGAKKITNGIIQKLQVYGFWTILLIGIGFFLGVQYCNKTRSEDISNAIKLQGFLYKSEPYNISKRIVQ